MFDNILTLSGEEWNEVYTAMKDVHDNLSSISLNDMSDFDIAQLMLVESVLTKMGDTI